MSARTFPRQHKRGTCEVVIAEFVFGPKRCDSVANHKCQDAAGGWHYICRSHMRAAKEASK